MNGKGALLPLVREVWSLVWSVASGYARRRLVIALITVLTTSAVMALVPVVLKHVVDDLAGGQKAPSAMVVLLVCLYALAQWLSRALVELRGFFHAQAERRMYRTLSNRLFTHVMGLPLRYHLERRTGAVNEILSNGLQGYQMVLHILVYTILPVSVQLGTVAMVLYAIEQPTLIGIFAVALVLYALAYGTGAVKTARSARDASGSQVEARAIMTDSILNYESVKYFAAEPFIQKRLDDALAQNESQWIGFSTVKLRNGLVIATIFAAFLAVTVLYSARQTLQGAMSIGTFVLVNTYMLQLVAPMEQMGYALKQLSQGFSFLEKMLELFREKPEPASDPAGADEGSASPDRSSELVFENVGVAYRTDRPVLKDISFRLTPGRTVGIVGASGAGKSTMVRLLVRFIEPDSGRILLGGVPLSGISLQSLRRSISVVPQDTVLFNDTIGENIAFGRLGSCQEEIVRGAKIAHLHHLVGTWPEGYATRVGERGVKLSGGERQRVSIARAALKRPSIYVLDEATSSLDSQTEQQVLRNLRELSREASTLVITHRLGTVMHADEILVLHEGLIAERGTHTALLALGGRYAALWKAQQAKPEQSVTPALTA